MHTVEVFSDQVTLLRAAAERIASLAETTTTTRGRFSIALSGGSTPRPLYELLGSEEFAGHFDWPLMHVFWSDERCVPPDHSDSNHHMARRALLDFVPLPVGNIYRMRGEIEPEAAADEYQRRLQNFFSGRVPGDTLEPRFDLILLGLGADGHTASLFPGTAVLEEKERWVSAVYVDKLESWRLTLTAPAINAASNILFLVTGENKAEALRTVLAGELQPQECPAQLIQPSQGDVVWLADKAAASLL